MAAATLFGLAFPYFLIRVPHGLAYTYTLHWLYYAGMTSVARLIAAGQ